MFVSGVEIRISLPEYRSHVSHWSSPTLGTSSCRRFLPSRYHEQLLASNLWGRRFESRARRFRVGKLGSYLLTPRWFTVQYALVSSTRRNMTLAVERDVKINKFKCMNKTEGDIAVFIAKLISTFQLFTFKTLCKTLSILRNNKILFFPLYY